MDIENNPQGATLNLSAEEYFKTLQEAVTSIVKNTKEAAGDDDKALRFLAAYAVVSNLPAPPTEQGMFLNRYKQVIDELVMLEFGLVKQQAPKVEN